MSPEPAPLAEFTHAQQVLFRHCDPAGIVFYPRYFEMLNDCVEALFAERLGWPFQTIHASGAVPTAHLSVDFTAPSHHGDLLGFVLRVTRLGDASLTLEWQATCGDEMRMKGSSVLVNVGPEGRPRPWPDTMRRKLNNKDTGTT